MLFRSQVDGVAQFKHAGVLHQEGQHAPVDAVGAVALGCILLGKVGRAAQHALAGSRLLTCGAIAGLIGKDGGANVGGCGVRLVTGLFQRGIHSLYFFRQSACDAGFVQSLDCLGATDIGRVLAGQGELCQAQRVGAEGRSLTGGDQLIGGGDRVGDVADNLDQQVIRQFRLLRPILDVGAKAQGGFNRIKKC